VDNSSLVDEAYSYDANGNRTNSGYATGGNNQLLSDGVYNYQYDNEGNRTKRTEIATGKVTEYGYNYRNRLTSLVFKDGNGTVSKSVEYVYDVNNERIAKAIDGLVTERFVYDRGQISLVFDGTGNQTHRYLYGMNIDQVLAVDGNSQTQWFLTDHQGSVKDVVDNTGSVVSHIQYDSFGNIQSQTTPVELRYAYTGREWDGESGQYYYRARYYDAGVGRFISEDPIGFNAGDGNLTRYVFNSSVNFVDPSGKDVWIETGDPSQVPLHQKIVVGNLYDTSGNLAFSFAPKNGPAFVDRGHVYHDDEIGGGDVVRFLKTTRKQDDEIRKYLLGLLNREAVYELTTLNCRKFSYDRFEQIKKRYNLTEISPAPQYPLPYIPRRQGGGARSRLTEY
jgi:RHS repeat-associated protein